MYQVSQHVLDRNLAKNRLMLRKAKKTRESLFTVYLSSADLTSI